MKKTLSKILTILTILTVAAIWALSATACFAQTLNAEQFKVLVANQVKQNLKSYELDEIEVIVGNAPVEKFILPDGNIAVVVSSNSNGMNAKEYKKVSILVDKKNAYTTFVSVEIKAHKNVLVAKEAIYKDKALSSKLVELKKTDVTRYMGETLTMSDLERGLLAKKMFYPGEVITKKYVASKPDIIKDSMVYVSFQTDSNITITVDGIAMMQGNLGDIIQVKNKKLNRVYTGTVVGENRVLVQI